MMKIPVIPYVLLWWIFWRFYCHDKIYLNRNSDNKPTSWENLDHINLFSFSANTWTMWPNVVCVYVNTRTLWTSIPVLQTCEFIPCEWTVCECRYFWSCAWCVVSGDRMIIFIGDMVFIDLFLTSAILILIYKQNWISHQPSVLQPFKLTEIKWIPRQTNFP